MVASSLLTTYLGSGPLAARPPSPAIPAGGSALYYATDSSVLYVYDGSTWDSVGGGSVPVGDYAYDPPIAGTDLPTAVLGAGCTLTATDVSLKGLSLELTTGTQRAAARVATPPSTPFTVTALSSVYGLSNAELGWGICLRNSSNNRMLVLYETPSSSVIAFQSWADITTFNGAIDSVSNPNYYRQSPVYLAVHVSAGGTVTAYWSSNGANWLALATTTTLGAYLTAAGGSLDQVGLWQFGSTTSNRINTLCKFWRVDTTNPPAVAV